MSQQAQRLRELVKKEKDFRKGLKKALDRAKKNNGTKQPE